ncbi:MAG TPA: HAMP domain-containing sensor histidine kinase [Microbacterium sp.]|nr:HAMP domain-containing sensor histidine kinase [Microbacterium sp.]
MRRRGASVRLKLALSYAGFVILAGGILLAVVWLFLLRYVPDEAIHSASEFVPSRSDLIRAFTPRVIIAAVFLVVFGLAGGWFLAGRMLAPLDRITAATRRAAAGSLSHRIRLDGPADEFRELADAFDQMLARIEAHVDEQRRFAANASHELRTPLATTRTLIEVAQSDPDADIPETLERVRVTNARAIALTEALLLLSRADRGDIPAEDVDLSLDAEEAIETLGALAEARGVDIDARCERATTRGSPSLLGQLVTNLVHNAIVHNLPAGGQVTLVTSQDDRSARLAVSNSGPVVPAELVPTLTEPFQRAAGRTRSSTHDGTGLGLAIASRIVAAHGGTLRLDAPPTGGLAVEVVLPR